MYVNQMISFGFFAFIIFLRLALLSQITSANSEPGWLNHPGPEPRNLEVASCGFTYFTIGESSPVNDGFEAGGLQGRIAFFLPAENGKTFCSEKFMESMIETCNNPGVMRLLPELVKRDPPLIHEKDDIYPRTMCEMQYYFTVPKSVVKQKQNYHDAVDTTCLVTAINCARVWQQKRIERCV